MKYALVTGGSGGIGRAICLKLADMGYNVLINYRSSEEKAREVLAEVAGRGVHGELLRFDVARPAEVEQALTQWQNADPGREIEVLVNNAGIRKDNLLLGMSSEEWHSVLDAGIGGFFHVTRAVLRGMVRRRYGRIINIVSLSGLKGLPGQTNYAASKAAIIGATRSLAKEVGKRNVTVNAVAPGYIRTAMIRDLDEQAHKVLIPVNRFGEPGEVAELTGFLAGPHAAYITGQTITIDGGLSA